jgi:hypothetical protein
MNLMKLTDDLRSRTSALILIGLSIVPGALLPAMSTAQTEPPKDGRYYEAAARKAYQAKDYPAFLENMKLAAGLRPNHPRLTYNLAVAYAINGRRDEALASLRQVADMGMIVPAVRDPDFDSIKEAPEFAAILARIEANKLPIIKSSEAFSVHEKGLVPESVAFDPVSNTFFLSSVYRRKIVSVGDKGVVKDFAGESDGLWSVMGMKVDATRRLLWVCTAVHPQMSNYKAEENGLSGVFKFDLRSGKLVQKYLLTNKPKPHWLGDLTLDAQGNVFASDSISPAIYVIRSGKNEIELFLEDKAFASPQGLAFTPDEKGLFMADYANGIFLIDMANRSVKNFAPPANGTLLGIDGLYQYKGNLLGVQNGVNPNRLVRLVISADQSRIESMETIEANNPVFDEPTLGVLVKDDFYFIANSQWGANRRQGQFGSRRKT